MTYPEARHIADRLVELLSPVCARIEIAGSVRREKPEGIKDVELCVIPCLESLVKRPGLFDDIITEIVPHNDLAEFLSHGSMPGQRLKGQPTGKYLQYLLHESFTGMKGINLDLFVCTPETWGVNFTVRTGSRDFSHGLARRWCSFGYTSREARLHHRDGEIAHIPEERDLFDLLRVAWVEPKDRHDASAVRGIR